MQHPRWTRSQAHSSQPISTIFTAASTTAPSRTSSEEVHELFDGPPPTLTPSASPMSDQQGHDVPPHLDPLLPGAQNEPPAIDPQLPQAMAALFQAMRINVQATQPAPPALPVPPVRPAPVAESRVRMCEPEPYDGSDPSKLRPFLSQCKLIFRSSPHAYADDQLKIMYAVSYLKGTAQC